MYPVTHGTRCMYLGMYCWVFSALHVLPKSPKILTLKPIIYDFVSLRGVGSWKAQYYSMCRKNGFSFELPIFFSFPSQFSVPKDNRRGKEKKGRPYTLILFFSARK